MIQTDSPDSVATPDEIAPNAIAPDAIATAAIASSQSAETSQGSAPTKDCRACGNCKCSDDASILASMNHDGSRRWIEPKLFIGKWFRRRRMLAYGLIAFFVALPHFRFRGKPIVLLDIVAREFTFLGHTFLPTDTLLLALAMLAVFVIIMAATALTGRLWCGWGCPQTVYMEFVFRPIDRWISSTVGKGGKPKKEWSSSQRFSRFAIYAVLCAGLAHTFLSYFVGTDQLATWLTRPPTEHPVAFMVMLGVTAAMMFDFMVFREQMCTLACPYGRFQSVMLDRSSLIVAYDQPRGEPRRKGKAQRENVGDCIDCNRCVAVCPMGIDIRQGLQMECINCTACIDVCDDVMQRVGGDAGLIGFTSQDALEGKPTRLVRPRTLIYPAILVLIGCAFFAVLRTKYAFDALLMRSTGNPYYQTDDGQIVNRFRLRLTNRSDSARTYQAVSVVPAVATIQLGDEPAGLTDATNSVALEKGDSRLIPITVSVPPSMLENGRGEVEIELLDDLKNERSVTAKILGPRR